MTGGSNSPRLSLAALIAVKPGQAPRLIYRTHTGRRHGNNQRKGFTETEYAQLLDAAHQQLGGPLIVVWDNLNTHLSAAMAGLIAARDWLTVYQLPPYATRLVAEVGEACRFVDAHCSWRPLLIRVQPVWPGALPRRKAGSPA